MRLNKIFVIIAIAAVIAIIGWSMSSYFTDTNTGNHDNFAKCITGKGATMYGADWCSHCQEQKGLFGSSFKFVHYIECPQNPDLCLQKGIEGYPTWIINGESRSGVQSLEKLSSLTGCPLS